MYTDDKDPDFSAPLSFKSPADFRSRSRYKEEVDPTLTKPDKILGPYNFDEPTRCGLKDCHQSHLRGYVVRTTDGMETNIGWVCGRKHFGVEFVLMRKHFDQAEKTYRYSTRLHEIVADSARIHEQIRSLNESTHGGKWLLKGINHFVRVYPREVVAAVHQRAEQGELPVFQARRRTSAEFEDAKASSPGVKPDRLRYVSEPRGTVRGIAIFTLDSYRWPLYELSLELNELLELKIDSLKFNEMSHWYKWATELEQKINDAARLIEEGRKFFKEDNLALLQYITEDLRIREQLARTTWSYDSASGEVKKPKRTKAWKRMMKHMGAEKQDETL